MQQTNGKHIMNINKQYFLFIQMYSFNHPWSWCIDDYNLMCYVCILVIVICTHSKLLF